MTRRFAIALLVVYAAATLYLALHHEPWRDEADSWLLVNNASLPEIFNWTRYAGTPALWYMLLKPLAWMRLPYISQTLLHLVLAWAAAAVFVLFAPFSRLTKVLFLASYYLIYEYAVIARSYVLTNLLLFIAAALYTRRHERPFAYAVVIALMFNTNVHAGVVAATLLVLFVVEERRPRLSVPIAIMLTGALLAFLQLRTPPDAFSPTLFRNVNDDALPFTIGQAFLPAVPLSLALVAGTAFLILVAITFRRRPDALLLILGPLAVLTVLYRYVWFGGLRHAGILLILVVAALWIAAPPEKIALLALNVILALSALLAIRVESQEIRFAFSGSKEMAGYIRDHHLEGIEIAAHKPYEAEAVLPYLPGKKFWYAGLAEYGTYLHWDRRLRHAGTVSYEEAQQNARRHFTAQNKPWLLLLNAPMPAPSKRGYALVYATQRRVFRIDDEKYFLYRPLPLP